MAGKRAATSELNHENWNAEEEPEEVGEFKQASADELKRRKILRPKRKLNSDDTPNSNPFGSVSFSFGFGTPPVVASTIPPVLAPADSNSSAPDDSNSGGELIQSLENQEGNEVSNDNNDVNVDSSSNSQDKEALQEINEVASTSSSDATHTTTNGRHAEEADHLSSEAQSCSAWNTIYPDNSNGAVEQTNENENTNEIDSVSIMAQNDDSSSNLDLGNSAEVTSEDSSNLFGDEASENVSVDSTAEVDNAK